MCAISILALGAAAMLIYLGTGAPTWWRAIELVVFAPLALPAAGLSLVTAVVVLLLAPPARRWMPWCLATGATLMVGAALVRVAPLFVGSGPTTDQRPSLVVMAQNLEFGDPRALAEKAIQSNVDLLVVTDASAPTIRDLRATALRRDLPHIIGIGEAGPEGSVVFSRYPVTEVARISHRGDSRVVTAHTPHIGDVELLALHPRPPYEKKAWIDDYEQISAYLLTSASPTTAERPVVIAGDLNATLDHAPIRQMRAMGFIDSVDQLNLGFQPTWPAEGSVQVHGVAIPPLAHIDHVLSSPHLVATEFTRFQLEEADHFGVCVELRRTRA